MRLYLITGKAKEYDYANLIIEPNSDLLIQLLFLTSINRHHPNDLIAYLYI